MTASAFSLTLTLATDSFSVTAGTPVIGGLHGPDRHFFCPHCMSWMFTRPAGMDAFVNLRPSMLDEYGWFVPFLEVSTQEKLTWVQLPAVHRFAAQPEASDYERLMKDYAARGARPAPRS